MNITEFRARALKAMQDAQRNQPQSFLHLVYAPELADPLGLHQDERRDTAHLRPLNGVKMTWPKEAWPRVITLDCRRVAAYLLESDPGLDDPLLEASITQAHAEVFLGMGVNNTVTNDDPGFAENAVCGWIVTPETAQQVAARINRASTPRREAPAQPGGKQLADRQWVHWYQPEYFSVLWPTLSTDQRKALLGPAVWITHNVTGDLQQFLAETTGVQSPQAGDSPLSQLRVMQWQALDNAPLVKQLTKQWQALCEQQQRSMPHDAAEQLHRHVKAAQEQHLDGGDLSLIVMVAVQLAPGAIETSTFRQMVQQALHQGTSLSEGLGSLPDEFWEHHALPEPTS